MTTPSSVLLHLGLEKGGVVETEVQVRAEKTRHMTPYSSGCSVVCVYDELLSGVRMLYRMKYTDQTRSIVERCPREPL